MNKPRIALAVGIIFISIFPILMKMNLTPPVVSAFYRMLIAFLVLLPYVLITGKLKKTTLKLSILSILCGFIFGMDVGVWNVSIQGSTATQATLLTNLSPIWVGIGAFFFLKDKPKRNFWIGTVIAIFGMVLLVGFKTFYHLNFNYAFGFAILSGMLYAVYMLLSKNVLEEVDVWNFMTLTLLSSTISLGLLSLFLGEPFIGYSQLGWITLLVQGLICQLAAWLLISYATKHMRATRVSVSLLGQAVLAAIFASIFINEAISIQMVIGGLFLLFGIRVTFIQKQIGFKKNSII
ncbi:MAG TPA: DMT family transporter [Edaphocola sp.]|nr:DMT family transporter [Edaphocola sp.]